MLAEVVAEIGTENFYRKLFDGVRSELGACQLVVQRYCGVAAIELLGIESDDPLSTGVSVGRYLSRLHRSDPFLSMLSPVPERALVVRAIATENIGDSEYRNDLFASRGLVGKLSMIVREPHHAISLSIYRHRSLGVFCRRDLELLQGKAPILAAAVERHAALYRDARQTVVSAAARLRLAPVSRTLSDREATVAAHAALGYSNLAISLQLGVSIHSVTTYRRRAYAKLGVTSALEVCRLAF